MTRHPSRVGRIALAVIVLLTGMTLLLGYANKARCAGPEFDAAGRSTPGYAGPADPELCYSDIQHLWLGRDIERHVFPYVSGGMTADGSLAGGTVEYPVLTGVLIWLAAIPVGTDAGFLLTSALLMAPFGLLTGWLLGWLSGWRALLWALGPPLALYGFHNWDLPVVACMVGAVFAVHGWRTSRPLPDRAVVAAVLLGVGSAFKLYPAAFVLPLAAYVLLSGASTGHRPDWKAALRVIVAAAGTASLINLPFALAGYDGWRASFTYQAFRRVDVTTNSVWFWAFRPHSDPLDSAFQSTMDWVSPTLVLVAFTVALTAGFARAQHVGYYPWLGVSAAMLCGFLLLHKVHSPQYMLWLLPFFVLLRIRWGWIAAYLLADLTMGLGIFYYFHAIEVQAGQDILGGFAAQAVMIGVWGRAALLVVLFVQFLRAHEVLLPRTMTPSRRAERRPQSPAAARDPALASVD